MSLGFVQKSVLYIKEIQEVGLFTAMADSRLFVAFGASPLYYVMLPMIGLLMTVLAVINGYQLAQASNKNFDKWSGFIVSALCAALASVSLYGGTISTFLGLTFAAGPWFFLSSVVLGFAHQSVMLGINLYSAYESRAKSAQRMHYIQAAFNNLFILGLLASIIGTVVFVLLFPIAPVAATVCAVSAATFIFSAIVWRVLPYSWKHSIKNSLNLGKPELMQQEQQLQSLALDNPASQGLIQPGRHHRLFARCDYSADVKQLSREEGETYLQSMIDNKLATFNDVSEKTLQKRALLNQLSAAITRHTIVTKNALLNEFPLGFQSFWSEKGDVEQLVDAVIALQNKEATPTAQYSPG